MERFFDLCRTRTWRHSPVAFELIGEARKMASKVNFKVKCVIAGGAGTIENAHKLLDYGVDQVFAYEDEL